MRYSTFLPTTVLSLLIAVGPQASAATYTGKDDKLEWIQQETWATSGKPLHLVRSLDGKYTFILNDQQQIVVHDQAGAIQGRIPVAKGVKAIDISPQGEFLYLIDQDASSFTAIALDFVITIDTAGSPVKGDAAAPVSIIVFTDFNAHTVSSSIQCSSRSTRRTRARSSSSSKHAAAVSPDGRTGSDCRPGRRRAGQVLEFHDRLFAAPQLSPEVITKIAQDLGLDMTRFESDRNSPLLRQKLGKDMSTPRKQGSPAPPPSISMAGS